MSDNKKLKKIVLSLGDAKLLCYTDEVFDHYPFPYGFYGIPGPCINLDVVYVLMKNGVFFPAKVSRNILRYDIRNTIRKGYREAQWETFTKSHETAAKIYQKVKEITEAYNLLDFLERVQKEWGSYDQLSKRVKNALEREHGRRVEVSIGP